MCRRWRGRLLHDSHRYTTICGGKVGLLPSGVTKLQDTCGARSDAGVYEQTWTANDSCGLRRTLSRTVTIVNNVPPTIDPLTILEQECASKCATDGTTDGCFTSPTVTSICGADLQLTSRGVTKVQDICGPQLLGGSVLGSTIKLERPLIHAV